MSVTTCIHNVESIRVKPVHNLSTKTWVATILIQQEGQTLPVEITCFGATQQAVTVKRSNKRGLL